VLRPRGTRGGPLPFALVAMVGLLALLPGPPAPASAASPALPPLSPLVVVAPAATTYTEVIAAPDLAASVTFSFEFDGTVHTAPGGGSVRLTGLAAGAYTLSNLTATPAPAGWEYFGTADPAGPVLVPQALEVNLSFSLLNLSSPIAPVHFHESHIPVGTRWALDVNGTTYTSATLWINVSSRSGTVPVQALSTADARGTTRYNAPAPDPAMSVAANATYSIVFTVQFLVQVYASPGGFVIPNGTAWYSSGENLTIRAVGYAGYAFGSWNGTGATSYSGIEPRRTFAVGGAVVETATFWPIGQNRQVIRIDQTGIPTGVIWTVYVNGGGFASATGAVVVPNVFPCGPGGVGLYNLSIPAAVVNASDPLLAERYVPGPYPGSTCGGTVVNVTFFPQSLVSYRSSPGGTVTATNGSGPVPSGAWVPNGGSVTFVAVPDLGYEFAGWSSNGSGTVGPATTPLGVTVGSPVEEVARFTPTSASTTPTYPVVFALASPLPAGATWSVRINGTSYASALPNLTVPDLPSGMYLVAPLAGISPDGLTQFQPTASSIPITVPTTGPTSVSFSVWYRVVVDAASGGAASANTTWAPAGSTVILTASPSAGDRFLGWSGTGPGNYSGASATVTVQVLGPLEESATFAPASSPPHNWNLVIVAVTGGAVVGILVAWRFPRRRAASSAPPTTEAPSPEDHADP